MMHQTRFTLLFVLLALCSPLMGCGIDTNPFPSSSEEAGTAMPGADSMGDDANSDPNMDNEDADAGGVDGGAGDMETSETDSDEFAEQGRAPYTIFHASQRQIVVGEAGSVNTNGLVQIFGANQTELAQTSSASDGSFALNNETSLPGTIKVQSSNQTEEPSTIQIGLTDATVAAYASSTQLSSAWADSEFTSDSGLSLETAGDTLEFSGTPTTLVPGLTVVLANLSRSMAMAAQVNTDGSFSAWVEADSGDRIAIFTVEHGSSNGGGTPLIIQAP